MDTSSQKDNASPQYDMAALRELLNAAFNDSELTTICFDNPPLKPVYENFALGMGKAQKIQLLLDYCERNLFFDVLIAIIKAKNPRQYALFANKLLLTSPSTGQAEAIYNQAKEYKPLMPPNVYLRKCLVESFSIAEIKTFCQDYFGTDLWRRVEKMDYDAAVSELINYCNNRGKVNVIWDHLKVARPAQYERYYELWLKATQSRADN